MGGSPVSASPARRAAREIVSAVRVRGAWAHETADGVLKRRTLPARDVPFATRLAYGTIAALGTLDEVIDAAATRPGDIEPKVRDALQVSAYELLFASTPARAAVSEGVELVRSITPRAAGLANAVLRKVAERVETFPWGDSQTDDDALARRFAHPQWIAQTAIDALGREAAAQMLAADNEPAPLYLAHNPFRGTLEEAMAQLESDGAGPEAAGLPGALRARVSSSGVRGRALAEGLVVASDLGAQMAVRICDPQPGSKVVEIGSGRGTKTLQLQAAALAAGGVADVLSIDLFEFKTALLSSRMTDLVVPGVRTETADATDREALLAAGAADADLVFVDAPCSGLGTLRRHPDKRWRMAPEEVESMAAIGASLLSTCAELVRAAGVVVYSTCTIASQENEDVIEGFLGGGLGSGFEIDSVARFVPPDLACFVTEQGFFRSWPTLDGPDGHFVARLVRK